MGPGFKKISGVGEVAAGDVAGELPGRVNQVPVVPELHDCLLFSGDLHFAERHGSSKVLLVEGTQAGGIEVLLEDSVLLTEVHGVDLVAVH